MSRWNRAGSVYHDIGEPEAAFAHMRSEEGSIITLAKVDVEVGRRRNSKGLRHCDCGREETRKDRRRPRVWACAVTC